MLTKEKELIGIKIGSFTTSIGKSSKKNKVLTFDLLLLDNNTYRQIPSIYTFETTTNQYIGMIANAHLKKSINYTIENISRLISIETKTEFGKKEMENIKYAKWDPKREKFIVLAQDGIATRLPSEIVPSYIGLLKSNYLPELGKNEEVYINIPDYLTYIQKKKYIELLNDCHINGYLIPESVAYTLYYGYTKSGDLFINYKIRYVILIDVGHCKTTYIFAKYEENKYQILDLETHQFGGRDIDNLLYKYFLTNNKIDENTIKKEKLLKFKFKLYEQIKEIKQMIAVNNEYEIGIDKLDGEEKLNVQITRNEFEKVTEDILKKIIITFNTFLKKCYKQVGPNLIIEILSDLLKIPYLKINLENNNYKIKVSQTVQHDESIAIGCCLYGSFKNKIYPQKNFEGILGHNTTNIYYSINSGENKIFLNKGEIIPIKKTITVNLKNDLQNEKMRIKIFYLLEDIRYYSNECFILEFDFSPNEEIKNNAEEVDIHLNVDINGLIDLKNISYTKNFPFNKNRKKNNMITFIENDNKNDIKQIKIQDNPFERDEKTTFINSNSSKILDNIGNEISTSKNKIKDNIQENKNNQKNNKNMETFNVKKKELKEFLDVYDNHIKEKNLIYNQKDKMDHNQFMQQCWNKFNQLSNEGDIFKLYSDVSNRLTLFNNQIKNEIKEMEIKIKKYIQKINNKITDLQIDTSKSKEYQINKSIQLKEELEKLEIKLKVSVDKNDITQIQSQLNQLKSQLINILNK